MMQFGYFIFMLFFCLSLMGKLWLKLFDGLKFCHS